MEEEIPKGCPLTSTPVPFLPIYIKIVCILKVISYKEMQNHLFKAEDVQAKIWSAVGEKRAQRQETRGLRRIICLLSSPFIRIPRMQKRTRKIACQRLIMNVFFFFFNDMNIFPNDQ